MEKEKNKNTVQFESELNKETPADEMNYKVIDVSSNSDVYDFELTGRKIGYANTNKTFEQTMNEGWAYILQCKEKGTVLRAEVSAVIPASQEFPLTRIVLPFRGHKIYIASDDFFEDEDMTFITHEPNQNQVTRSPQRRRWIREGRYAQSMMGATVNFVITDAREYFDEEGKRHRAITGSRRIANAKIRSRYFFSESAKSRPIMAGDIVSIDVMRVSSKNIVVNFLGHVTRIGIANLCAYKWSQPAVDFKAGDSFDVAVKEIEYDLKNKKIDVVLSKSILENHIALEALNQIIPNSYIAGEISFVTANRKTYFVNLKGHNCKAIVPVKTCLEQDLVIGDEVLFLAQTVDFENVVVVGMCESLNRKR